MFKRKWHFFLGFLVFLSLLVAACSSASEEGSEKEPDDSTEGVTEETEEAPAGGNDLIIASHSEAVLLDPHMSTDVPSANVAYNIYEQLVTFDENMELVGSLAEDWYMVDDTTWEFKLRQGVTFHDGSEFNAEVVKANFERVLDPQVASPRAFLYEMVNEIEVVDDYTVRFHLDYPFVPFPAHLTHNGGAIVSLEAIEKDYEAMENGETPGSYINSNPSGTGYFKLDEWVSGDYIKLVRNDDYWGEKAKLDSVTFKVVNEPLTRIAELERGHSHIIEPLNPSDVARVEDLDNAHAHLQTSTALNYIGFNLEKEPFTDVRVRQAISHAIDKTQITEGIYEGTGIPAIGPIAPDVWGFDPDVKPLEYNMDRAKQLLEEAGYADGFSTTIWTNDNPDRIRIAEYVQSALKELNIDVSIEVLEWGTYLDETAAGNHEMFILGWSTATGDADYALYPLFHSSNIGDPGNMTFIQDDELDELLDAARVETDEATRMELYRQVQEKLVELAPMIYVNHTDNIQGVSDRVKGFAVTPSNMFLLQNVTLEE